MTHGTNTRLANRAAILRAGRDEQEKPAAALDPEIVVESGRRRKSRRILILILLQ